MVEWWNTGMMGYNDTLSKSRNPSKGGRNMKYKPKDVSSFKTITVACLCVALTLCLAGQVLAARVIEEGFESPGYEGAWTEAIDPYCRIDDAFAPIPGTPPAGAGSYCMEGYTQNNYYNEAYAYQAGSPQNISYVRAYIYVDYEGFSNGQLVSLTQLYNAGQNRCAGIQIGQSGGSLAIRGAYYDSGEKYTDIVSISLDTWYRVEFKYDIANSKWEFRLYDGNESLQYSHTDNALGATRIPSVLATGMMHHSGSGATRVLTDLVAWDNATWVGTESISISGTAYESEGGSPLAYKPIFLSVDGGDLRTDLTDADGTYGFTNVEGVSAGSTITVWIKDGPQDPNGTTVTIANDDTSSISGLDIYGSALIVRSDKTGTPITNNDLEAYDQDQDGEIHFTCDSGTLAVDSDHKLRIWNGTHFSPGGAVNTSPGGITPGGDGKHNWSDVKK
jgi:hypothetical protein